MRQRRPRLHPRPLNLFSPSTTQDLKIPNGTPKKPPTFRQSWTNGKLPSSKQQAALAQAADRVTQPGVALDKPTIGVTPQAAIAILEAQVGEVQSQLDELSDLARQNNIPPGVLRG